MGDYARVAKTLVEKDAEIARLREALHLFLRMTDQWTGDEWENARRRAREALGDG